MTFGQAVGILREVFYYFFLVVVITHNTRARMSSTDVHRRVFVNDAIAIAVWTSFFMCVPRSIAR